VFCGGTARIDVKIASWPGLQAPAAAAFVSVLIYLPVMVGLAAAGRFTARALFYAACAGLLCSVVPYAMDVMLLRRVPARFFGVFMSVNPVLAALAGIVILGQVLNAREWAGITIVIAANAVATTAAERPERKPGRVEARPPQTEAG